MQTENPEVIDSNTAPESDKTGSEKEPVLDAKELQRQLEHERNLRKTAEERSNYWLEQAKGKGGKPEPKEQPEDDDDDLDVDLFEVVTSNDKKTFAKTVGALIDKKASKIAQEIVNRKAAEVTGANKVFQDNPELTNQDSDLFKETQRQAAILKDDPDFRGLSETALLKAAVTAAKAELGVSSRGSRRRETEDYDDTDRVRRIRAQQGSTGSRRAGEREGGELSESQRFLARQIIGTDDAEERYRKRATAGIQMGGRQRA